MAKTIISGSTPKSTPHLGLLSNKASAQVERGGATWILGVGDGGKSITVVERG
jgi:hypothetical protein